VTSVVGRAEQLSSIFYLWALMMYAKSIGKDRHTGLLFIVIFCQSHMSIGVWVNWCKCMNGSNDNDNDKDQVKSSLVIFHTGFTNIAI